MPLGMPQHGPVSPPPITSSLVHIPTLWTPPTALAFSVKHILLHPSELPRWPHHIRTLADQTSPLLISRDCPHFHSRLHPDWLCVSLSGPSPHHTPQRVTPALAPHPGGISCFPHLLLTPQSSSSTTSLSLSPPLSHPEPSHPPQGAHTRNVQVSWFSI